MSIMKEFLLKMKIKTFKYFESVGNEYYHEISDSEVEEFNQGDEEDEDGCIIDHYDFFTEEDYRYITSFLPTGYIISFIDSREKSSVIWISYRYESIKKTEHCFSISKIKDEWFLIGISTSHSNHRVYKCDQLDGLEKCIKEKCI